MLSLPMILLQVRNEGGERRGDRETERGEDMGLHALPVTCLHRLTPVSYSASSAPCQVAEPPESPSLPT
jgi:hypothetical protein